MSTKNVFLDDVEFEKLFNEIRPKLKRSRDKICLKDKERLVKAYDDGQDYVDLGDKLGINRHTVYSIIRVYRKFGTLSRGKHGGYKKPIITGEIGGKLLEFIEEKPLSHLREMKEFLQQMNISPSDHTISNYLHGKCVAINQLEHLVTNPDDVKEKRYIYVKNILDNEITMNQCIFIDECVFNFWIKRAYGRGQKVERVYRHCCGQRGTNVTVRLAISTTGVLLYRIYTNPLETQTIQQFMTELIEMHDNGANYYILSENFYNSVICRSDYTKLNKLIDCPVDSSFLNPISSVMSRLKELVKSRIPNQKEVIKMGMNGRKECLKKVIQDVIMTNFNCNFNENYSNCVQYFTKCYFKEDISIVNI